MLLWMIWLAQAEPFDPDAWEEVTPLTHLAGGLLDGDRAWWKRGERCLPAEITHGDTTRVVAERCAVTHGDITTRCTVEVRAELSWPGVTGHCEWTRPDGSGGSTGSGGTSSHDRPILVEHTPERARWRRAVRHAASVEQHLRVTQPCLPGTAPDDDQADPTRTCDGSFGLVQFVVPVGYARGVGIAQRNDPTPVDCREPCPINPDSERVRDLNARLSGRQFSLVGGEAITLYATEAACLADPTPSPKIYDDTDCQFGDPPPWEAP